MVRYGAEIVKIDPAPSARPAGNILGCFDQRWRTSAIGWNPIRLPSTARRGRPRRQYLMTNRAPFGRYQEIRTYRDAGSYSYHVESTVGTRIKGGSWGYRSSCGPSSGRWIIVRRLSFGVDSGNPMQKRTKQATFLAADVQPFCTQNV
jgi:hypothetical protein